MKINQKISELKEELRVLDDGLNEMEHIKGLNPVVMFTEKDMDLVGHEIYIKSIELNVLEQIDE